MIRQQRRKQSSRKGKLASQQAGSGWNGGSPLTEHPAHLLVCRPIDDWITQTLQETIVIGRSRRTPATEI
jgi:hypothetical protein